MLLSGAFYNVTPTTVEEKVIAALRFVLTDTKLRIQNYEYKITNTIVVYS